MIKTNLPNATSRNPMSGFTRSAYNAALRIFCATLGFGSAVAVADTFNVSTAAAFQAALNVGPAAHGVWSAAIARERCRVNTCCPPASQSHSWLNGRS